MANLFLDANWVLDIVSGRREVDLAGLSLNELSISVLSLHIFAYCYKEACPSKLLLEAMQIFSVVALTTAVLEKAATGPTRDLEDNIQLHSAVEAGCDLFITADQSLQAMGYFGSMKIVSSP